MRFLFTNSRVLFFLFLSIILCSSYLSAQPLHSPKDQWIDSVFQTLSEEQRIGQLIMIASPASQKPKEYAKVLQSIRNNNVGGICFFKGTTADLQFLSDLYQAETKTPLLLSIDGEWGLGMRITDGFSFPKQMTIGAIDDENLVYLQGAFVAMQCKELGIHINFAPCVDLNSNPLNPVINMRSFGENKRRVSRLASAYMHGMQDGGIMAVAKHFPGHGDTDIDSHKDLPVIHHNKTVIDSVDSYPFRRLIRNGIQGVMVGHLQVPALMLSDSISSSVSKEVIQDYLIDSLSFNGLVFTDALNMQGVTKYLPKGNAEVEALRAGVDVLLMPMNDSTTIASVKNAIIEEQLSQSLIDEKCKKVLSYKYDLGLYRKPLPSQSPSKQENSFGEQLAKKMVEQAITLVRNRNQLLPLQNPSYLKIALVDVNRSVAEEHFKQSFPPEWNIRYYDLSSYKSVKEMNAVLPRLDSMDVIIGTLYGSSVAGISKNYGVSSLALEKVKTIMALRPKKVCVLFGNPYLLSSIDSIEKTDAIVCGYQDMAIIQKGVVAKLNGLSETHGRLPVSVSPRLPEGFGLKMLMPDENTNATAHLHSKTYHKKMAEIDSLAIMGIAKGAYPGCQIVVLYKGNMIYNKSFGTRSVANRIPVTEKTIYDLASCTKIFATTLAMMKLYDDKKIDLNDPLSAYLPYLKETNKEEMTIKEVMSHVARLKAWIPFWKETVNGSEFDPNIYAFNIASDDTTYVQVCDGLFIKKSYKQTLLHKIATSKLNHSHKYEYSDLGFILLSDLVERLSGKPLDRYVAEHFYQPMNLEHITFHPLKLFPKEDIAPTENDFAFRKKLIHGFVHDQTAALMGGVSGHAGLFANASDVAQLCQMLMSYGIYNGKKYLDRTTIEAFNHRYFADEDVRRGLGFDKPIIHAKVSNCAPEASDNSFGHSGFTGTFFWADPDKEMVYVFLSNRVNPKTEPNLLAKSGIRTKIQTIIYQALEAE